MLLHDITSTMEHRMNFVYTMFGNFINTVTDKRKQILPYDSASRQHLLKMIGKILDKTRTIRVNWLSPIE